MGKPKAQNELTKRNQLDLNKMNARGTKSSRDIRSSMGFQELLN